MATLGTTALTYVDWAKRMDDNFKTANIVELLSVVNEILEDLLVIEGNLATGHKTTVRTGLPSGTWRLLNYGVPKAKSTTAQITDTCGNLEVYAEVDKDLADLNGNTASFRLSETIAFIQGLGINVADTLMYGNTAVNPERFMGVTPRFNTVSTATAQNAVNVVDGLGTGSDNTSIWVITWGADTAHGIFPKGKITGLQHKDLGEWTLQDSSGNQYQGYRDHFKWEIGLTVRDWRYIVRIANIDVSDLSGASAANIMNLLVRAINRLPTTAGRVGPVQQSNTPSIRDSMGRTVIYCNRTIRTYLDLQAMNKTNVLLKLIEVDGMVISTFRGIPIRTCDSILNTEARVV